MTHYDALDIAGIWACLSLLAVCGVMRLGLFLRGKLRPRFRNRRNQPWQIGFKQCERNQDMQ